eukprot:scaffold334_cov241-Pinguiococcus_pyrenoidosus.AAC.75
MATRSSCFELFGISGIEFLSCFVVLGADLKMTTRPSSGSITMEAIVDREFSRFAFQLWAVVTVTDLFRLSYPGRFLLTLNAQRCNFPQVLCQRVYGLHNGKSWIDEGASSVQITVSDPVFVCQFESGSPDLWSSQGRQLFRHRMRAKADCWPKVG